MSPRTRIAVVGFGLIGKRHAKVIAQMPELELAAVVEPGAENAKAAAALGATVYPELGEMLLAEKPDGIVLATPTPLHLAQGKTCIAAGCPILIEKPMLNRGKRDLTAHQSLIGG